MRNFLGTAVLVSCSLAIFSQPACSASAQAARNAAQEAAAYPTRPIRLITPAPPGGTTDLLARRIGPYLSDVWKQQVIVDNRGGAGGVVAAEITAKAAPDGYTLLMAYSSHTTNANLNPKVPYRPVDDYQPITQVAVAGGVLVVNPQLPIFSVKDLIAYGKANPKKLNFSSAGNGSNAHMALELFKYMTGVQAQHVPYKGTGPAIVDLIGGQIQASFTGMAPAQPLIRSGRIRAIAVSSARRVSALPDVPTVAEAGVPGFEATAWYGVLAPAGLPKAITAKLNAEMVKMLRVPEIRQRMIDEGLEVVGNSPAEFETFLRAEFEKWAKVVKATGAQLD